MYCRVLVLERAIIGDFVYSVRTVVVPFQTDEKYPVWGGENA